MQYRIHFETDGGFWCIQFVRWQMYWASVKESHATNDGPTDQLVVKKFETLEAAEKYVAEKGIDKAYERVQYTEPVPQYAGRH